MTSVTVQVPQKIMENFEKDDFGIVPYMGLSSAMNKDPMLNDCFFGSEQHMPSPLFRRNTSIEAVETGDDNFISSPLETQTTYNAAPAQVGSSFVACDQFQPYNQPNKEQRVCGGREIGNSNPDSIAREDWIEEWMDLNGIFDPAMELLCSECDLSPSPLRDLLKPTGDIENLDGTLRTASQDLQEQVVLEIDKERNLHEAAFIPAEPQNYPNLNGLDGNTAMNAAKGKNSVKEYIFRPAPMDLNAPSRAFAVKQQPRSAKIIKTSAAVPLSEMQKSVRRGQKTNPFITERKREQNRSAAVRYRDRRREEARRKKEELHGLELRNVSLKTQVSGLQAEIGYLRELLDEIICR